MCLCLVPYPKLPLHQSAPDSKVHGPLARYVKLRVRMRRECRERFPRHRRWAIPTCITARAWRTCRDACRDRQLSVSFEIGGGGKRSRHSRRMRNLQFYVSGKRSMGPHVGPMNLALWGPLYRFMFIHTQCGYHHRNDNSILLSDVFFSFYCQSCQKPYKRIDHFVPYTKLPLHQSSLCISSTFINEQPIWLPLYAWQFNICIIMSAMVSQIKDVSIVYSTICSGADQRKHKKGLGHWPLWGEFTGDLWIPPTKGQ